MMTELDGEMYHAVPTSGMCSVGDTFCHFVHATLSECSTKRMHLCDTNRGASVHAFFLTRDEYLKHIAAKITS